MTSKMIKDPIHGFIQFEGETENALKDLLSEPFFQRLRRVKQLGFSDYIFPSATHSRFAHSLGVYSVAKRMLSVVEPEARQGRWSPEGQACLAAALLHDIGHGMFSHAFEKAIKFFFERNPNQTGNLIGLKNAVDHEKVSARIILNSSVGVALTKLGGKEFPHLVANMIQKSRKGCIYTSIVSSQLDADRLDYAKRDPYFAGVSSGGIDLDWLIRNFRVGQSGDENFLYVNSKAYISLEQFTVTLFQLYPTLYLHKRTRGLEYMFALLMSKVFEMIASGNAAAAGISTDHPFVRFFSCPDDLQNALVMDDTLFWGSLYLLVACKDRSISTIAQRIASRNIYPMLDVWKIADEVATGYSYMKALSAAERVIKLHDACKAACEEVKKKKHLWTDGCYYDSYDRPIYKPKYVVGGNSQQINVDVGGKIVDIASISPLVASAASFNIHRVYYDDHDSDQGQKLEQELRAAVIQKLSDVEP